MKKLFKKLKKARKRNNVDYLKREIRRLNRALTKEKERNEMLSYDNKKMYAKCKKAERLYKELREELKNGKNNTRR